MFPVVQAVEVSCTTEATLGPIQFSYFLSMTTSIRCLYLSCVLFFLDSDSILHVFPNPEQDADRFRSWVLAIGGDILGLDNNWIYKNRRVCHLHFEQKYCYFSNKLSKLAIPTKKLPGKLSKCTIFIV